MCVRHLKAFNTFCRKLNIIREMDVVLDLVLDVVLMYVFSYNLSQKIHLIVLYPSESFFSTNLKYFQIEDCFL